ncbi:MAG: 30S ribosomal protein S20 [Lachnospiraceae bacterium]|nr:30S ribosomal protein S20 [Lachnospiraceae bacterium]
MANIKSAKKRILVTKTRADRNKAIRSKVKTAIKKVEAAIAAKDSESAAVALKNAISEIDKAQRKGVFHKNTAARKISRLTIAVNKIA